MNVNKILRTPIFEDEVKEGYFLILKSNGEMLLSKIKEKYNPLFWTAHSFQMGVVSSNPKIYIGMMDKCLDVSAMISKERKEELDSGISKNLLGVDILGNKINKNDEVLFGRQYNYERLEVSSVHDKIVKCNGTFVKLNNCLNFSNLINYFPELFL